MLFIGGFLMDIALLGVLLLVVAKVDFIADIMKPASVILLTLMANFVCALIFQGALWGVPQLVIVVWCLYFLLGWFFDLTQKEQRIIVGTYIGVKILLSIILRFL